MPIDLRKEFQEFKELQEAPWSAASLARWSVASLARWSVASLARWSVASLARWSVVSLARPSGRHRRPLTSPRRREENRSQKG
jgi:hypothetical protein